MFELVKGNVHLPYSRDLSSCDFHKFGALKKVLKVKRFELDAKIENNKVQRAENFCEQGYLG